MSGRSPVPPPRSLDIYRHVVARHEKQRAVAADFGVSPPRVCQVVRRVRAWVDDAIGDWLFPGRDDLRFYVALQAEQIRVHEHDDPSVVRFTGPDWNYTRHPSDAPPPGAATGATDAAYISATAGLNITLDPINSLPAGSTACVATTPNADNDLPPPALDDLARSLAQMLIVWRKSRSLGAAVRLSSF